MSDLLAGMLAALISTNTPVAVSNLVQEKTGVSIAVINPNDPVEKEYARIVADDDAASEEVEKWADDAQAASAVDGGQAKLSLSHRVRARLDGVKKSYQDFLALHPEHVRARLAFGSFLNETGDEEGALAQWEKARDLAPTNSAAWNNLGNAYEHGNIKKSFECYTKAIELDPTQSVYYHNLAVCVYMFRTDAEEYWKIEEPQVFDKALALYQKAMRLDPENFELATDYAECYYGIRPPRWKDGLVAWNQCLKIAHDEREREGVMIHLARINLNVGNFDEVQRNLDGVTNSIYTTVKNKISKNMAEAIHQVITNSPPALVR